MSSWSSSEPLTAAQGNATYAKVIGVPAGSTVAQINAAIAAAPADSTVYLVGAYSTSSTITITSHLDASAATINYTGTGIAVQVGTSSPLANKRILLPTVVNMSKTVLGWGQVAGSVGVKLLNLTSCLVMVPHVTKFETGVLLRGEGQGSAYNVVTLGGMDNNKLNMVIDADATGWANQNLFLGGRFSHDSGEGSNVAGTRQVQINVTTNVINTNSWVGSSFEGLTAEYALDIVAGIDNEWLTTRFETVGGARARWGAGALRNRIKGGYMADQIVSTVVAGAASNTVQTSNLFQVFGSDSGNGVVRMTNGYGATAPALAISDTENFAAWTWHHTAQQIQGKRPGDAYPRIILDAVNGAVAFGTGGSTPTDSFLAQGGGGIAVKGHVAADSNNVYDIGSGGYNPRYIRASTALVTGSAATGSRPAAATAGVGAMFFDTTLGKPIWSTGAAWKDATGTTV